MNLADLAPKRRRQEIETALAAILAAAPAPIGTRELSGLIAARLKSKSMTKWVARHLNMMAADGDPRAFYTGETFSLYGHTMRRQAWRPCPLTLAPLQAIENFTADEW